MSRRFSSSDATRRPGSLGQPYAIYSEILNADKTASGTKKKVRWLFGFSDSNEEQEVTMVHSLMSGKKTIFENGLEIVSSKGQLGQLEYAHSWNANAGPHVYRIESSLSFTSDHIYNFYIDGILFVNMPRGKSSGGSRNSYSDNQQKNSYSDSQVTGRYSDQEYNNSSSSGFNSSNNSSGFNSSNTSSGFNSSNTSSGFNTKRASVTQASTGGFGKERNSSIAQSRGSFQSPEQLAAKSSSDGFDPFSNSPDQNNFDPFKNAPKSTASAAGNRSRTSSSTSSAEKKPSAAFGKPIQQKVDTSFDPFGENAASPSSSSNQVDFFNSSPSPSGNANNASFDPFGNAPQAKAADILSTFAGMTVSAEPAYENKPTESINESITTTEKVEEVNKDPWAGNLVDLNLGKPIAKTSIKATAGQSLSSLMGSNNTSSSQPIMLSSQPVMLNPPPAPIQPMMNAPPPQPLGMAAFSNPYESMQFPPRPMMNNVPQQPMGMAAFNNPVMGGPGPAMMGGFPPRPMNNAQPMMGGPGPAMMGGPGPAMMGGPGIMGQQQRAPAPTTTMPAPIRPIDPFTNLNLPIKSSTSSTQSSNTQYQSKPIQNSLDFLDLGLKK